MTSVHSLCIHKSLLSYHYVLMARVIRSVYNLPEIHRQFLLTEHIMHDGKCSECPLAGCMPDSHQLVLNAPRNSVQHIFSEFCHLRPINDYLACTLLMGT